MSYCNAAHFLSFNTKPQRPVALILMVVIHTGLIFALMGGLTARPPSLTLDPAKVSVIDLPTRVIPIAIDTVPVTAWDPGHTIVEPPPVVAQTSDPIIPGDNGVRPGETAQTAGNTPVAPTITPPRSDSRYPLAQPAYPSASRRMGEEGTVELMVFVRTDGRIGAARVERSSGFGRLDDAALREALRSWRLAGSS